MPEEFNFEKAITRLSEIVEILEGGEISLEESITLFEEGTKLSKLCYKTLDEAEQKIINLEKEGED